MKEEVVDRLINLMYMIRNNTSSEKIAKNLCRLNKKEKLNINPFIDLEVE